MSRNTGLQRFIEFVAFIGLVLIGLAILFGGIFDKQILIQIALAVAIVVVAAQGFFFAVRKRNNTIMIVYVCALVFAVIVFILYVARVGLFK